MTPARHHPGLRLAAALALWAALIGALWARAGDTPVSRWLHQGMPPAPGASRADTLYRITSPEGLTSWLSEEDSADALTRALHNQSAVVRVVDAQSSHTLGLLWPWGVRTTITLQVTALIGSADAAAIRRELADRCRTQGRPDDASRIALGDQSLLQLDWSGPVMDLVTLLLAIWTVREAARAYTLARAARVRRRLRQGLCPACGYTLAPPTDAPVRCPECGRQWAQDAAAP